MKDKYLFQLHNKNSRDSSLHYTPFLFYFRELPGIPWGFPITIKRYPSQGRIEAHSSEGVKPLFFFFFFFFGFYTGVVQL